MKQHSRTDLCGGRPETAVPTATTACPRRERILLCHLQRALARHTLRHGGRHAALDILVGVNAESFLRSV